MKTFLNICEFCADTFGWFLTFLLFLLLLPVILGVVVFLFPICIVVGIISKLLGLTEENEVEQE